MFESKNSLKDALDFYHENGYTVIHNFLTDKEVNQLKAESKKLIMEMNLDDHKPKSRKEHVDYGSKYFMDSFDKIGFFFESESMDEDGNLLVPKEVSVHQIAHGLHLLDPVCRSLTFSDKVKKLVKELGFIDPRLIQAMYFLKQPEIGDKIPPHKDESYLTVEPEGKVMGLWFALDDATEVNGCLRFIPGSHKSIPLTTFQVRTGSETGQRLKWIGEADYVKQPEDFDYVPAIAPKGSCVLIHGLVVHKSAMNRSKTPRNAFAIHVYEGYNTKWSSNAWIQETSTFKFVPLYETQPDL